MIRRLSDEAPEESPVIQIHEKQWVLRNWLLGALVLAVLVLSGLIVAGIRINETREARNRAVAESRAQLAADLQDVMRRADAKTTDAHITGIVAAMADSTRAQAAVRVARMSAELSRLQKEQAELSTTLASLQECGAHMTTENEHLRAELEASNRRIEGLQAQRLADSLALAERNATLDRRLSRVADQTADVDRRVGKSSGTLRGIGGVTAANFAVGLIHLLGTKETSDVKPTTATVGQ